MSAKKTQFVRHLVTGVALTAVVGVWLTLSAPFRVSRPQASVDAQRVEPPAPTSSLRPPPGPQPASAPERLTLAKILPDTPPPEREYIEQLTELNRTDKQAALTLAEKGDEWYSSSGQLAEARRAMRITLLTDLQRMAEARAFTREFIARYPDSPYRRLVQGVTGIHPRPSGPRVPTSNGATADPP